MLQSSWWFCSCERTSQQTSRSSVKLHMWSELRLLHMWRCLQTSLTLSQPQTLQKSRCAVNSVTPSWKQLKLTHTTCHLVKVSSYIWNNLDTLHMSTCNNLPPDTCSCCCITLHSCDVGKIGVSELGSCSSNFVVLQSNFQPYLYLSEIRI